MEEINSISKVYLKLLKSIEWEDKLLTRGIKEGLNKFLSNAYLSFYKHKHYSTHYITKNALNKVKNKDFKGLVFEHLIPKQKYIQEKCIEAAKLNKIDFDFIYNLLSKYWILATVTAEENKIIGNKRSMPEGWEYTDEKSALIRCTDVGVELISNPFRKLK